MKHVVVFAGFALVAFVLYRTFRDDGTRPGDPPQGTLPQPAAPGLDHT